MVRRGSSSSRTGEAEQAQEGRDGVGGGGKREVQNVSTRQQHHQHIKTINAVLLAAGRHGQITRLTYSSKQRVCAPRAIDDSVTPPGLAGHLQQAAMLNLAWSFRMSRPAVHFIDVDYEYSDSFEEQLFEH
ncbi:hypothetical protein C8R44DRAFT_742978 [Mycena epipterygia]|nr:hypothetical protein C8R44DRAFT_742978 [Mycena epipterygia]